MDIKSVKPTDQNYALAVPLNILKGLNADFDGDVINIIGLETKEIRYIFRKFNPIEFMLIDRDTGMLNDYFTLDKGQNIDLTYFCTMGKLPNDRPEVYR